MQYIFSLKGLDLWQTIKKKLAHGTKVIEVTSDKLLSIVLPVPPLHVQREIVHIWITL